MRRMEGLKRRVSFADLQRMPDDGNRYELYDGELRVVPSPLPIHQIVVMRLLDVLVEFSRRAGGQVFTALRYRPDRLRRRRARPLVLRSGSCEADQAPRARAVPAGPGDRG